MNASESKTPGAEAIVENDLARQRPSWHRPSFQEVDILVTQAHTDPTAFNDGVSYSDG